MRKPCCGIAVRGDAVVAVRMRHGQVVASGSDVRGADEEWSAFLARVLRAVRGPSWRMPRLGVCVADRRCRVVPLFGAPADVAPETVQASFHAQPEAFAIAGVDGFIAGSVWKHDDVWRGVLLAKPMADALVVACREAAIELVAVAPSAAPDLDDLAQLATEASTLRMRDVAAVDPDADVRSHRRVRRRRVWMATIATGATLWATVAPPIASYRATRALEREAAEAERYLSTHGESGTVDVRATELRTRTDALAHDRGRASALLAGIASVLPDSSAITTLRMSDEGGSITLLAPRVADVVKRLATVTALKEARVVGAIVEEDHGGVALQRVTLSWSTGGRRE